MSRSRTPRLPIGSCFAQPEARWHCDTCFCRAVCRGPRRRLSWCSTSGKQWRTFTLCSSPPIAHRDLKLGNTLFPLATTKPLPHFVEQAFSMVLDIGRAVAHLHCLSPPIVHRDLKLENMLLTKEDRRYTVRLTDFGLHSVGDQSSISQVTGVWARLGSQLCALAAEVAMGCLSACVAVHSADPCYTRCVWASQGAGVKGSFPRLAKRGWGLPGVPDLYRGEKRTLGTKL